MARLRVLETAVDLQESQGPDGQGWTSQVQVLSRQSQALTARVGDINAWIDHQDHVKITVTHVPKEGRWDTD